MKGNKNIFQAVEGIDENGEAKAICCLMVEKRFGDMSSTPEIQDFAYMQDVCVSVSLTNDFAMVDLGFEDYVDYDYLQAIELCREFTDMTDACEFVENPDSGLSLVLSIVPKEEYDSFLMGMDAAWSFIPVKPEGMCNAIRLIFVREKFGTYEFEEATVKQLIHATERLIEER